jgi:hypothetical protein
MPMLSMLGNITLQNISLQNIKSGDDCTTSWKDIYPGWGDLFYFYTALTIASQLSIFLFSSYQLYRVFRYSTSKMSAVTWGLISIALGSFCKEF